YLEFLSLVGDRIVLKTPIEFAQNEMKLLKSSHPGLKKLAEYLQKNRQFRKIMIEGFGPARAGKAASERFSFDHATLVKEFLVHAGIEAQRLIAVGYGQVERTSIQEIEFTIVE